MSNDEAKFLLHAYRPGGRDANDPAMAAALAQAKSDPALRAWFEREQAHCAAVAAKLREIAPPAGLRDAILAGARASGGVVAPRPTAARSRRSMWLAAAAAVALLLSAGAWWRSSPVGGASMEEFAVNFVNRGFRLQQRGADVAVLKTWLNEQHGPLPESLPAEFARLRALGCRTLKYQGGDVSLVCFERDGKEFHVFVARRDGLLDREVEASPRFLDRGKLVAATWTDAKNRYVVVSDAGMETLKRLL
ncbi:MAG: hypothetical protein EXS37_09315 [Opitutus sp.]|nr:hypothetical protein [Opitutus sp.]